MLNNISWADYAAATGIILVIYYGVVWIIYFKNDHVGSLMKPREQRASFLQDDNRSNEPNEAEDMSPAFAPNEIANIKTIPEVLMDLQGIITDGANRKFPKEELSTALKMYLQQNAENVSAPESLIINQTIITQCERDCSFHLSEEDVRVLWIR